MISYEYKKRLISTIVLIPLIFFILFKGSYFLIFFLTTCLLITINEFYKMKINYLIKIIGSIFLLFSFYSFYALRNSDTEENLLIFLITFFTCISTDLGGFFFGKLFKGPKLTKISPNKTYSGVVGSYLISIMAIYFLNKNSNTLFSFNFEFNSKIIFFVIIISTISQIGDLIISYFKRVSNIKDTGNLIPGHGGILDRIDGMIFAFPLIYLFSQIAS